MAIYTRTGDKGMTSMFEPDPKVRCRVSKSDSRVQAIGAVDEVNSYLGVANYYCKSKDINALISEIQKNLFTIGAILSKAPLSLPTDGVTHLETYIDSVEDSLPPLRNFLMPEGSESAVHFMYARALARRAERRIVALHNRQPVQSDVLEYVNRLSDVLFCMFRAENAAAKNKEALWVGRER